MYMLALRTQWRAGTASTTGMQSSRGKPNYGQREIIYNKNNKITCYPSHAAAHLPAWKELEMLVARDDIIICVWLPATPHVSTPLRL